MESQKPPKRTRINPIGWVIMLLLLAWNVYSFWPRSQSQISIPYSGFVNQVKADHFKAVQIAGSSIKGEFTLPLPLSNLIPQLQPYPTPGTTPLASEAVTYTTFTTNFPDVVGDTNLMPLLSQHNVLVSVSPAANPWFTILLTSGLPILLMVGFLILLSRQATRGQESIFSFGRSKARRFVEDKNKVTFSDVAGAGGTTPELQER